MCAVKHKVEYQAATSSQPGRAAGECEPRALVDAHSGSLGETVASNPWMGRFLSQLISLLLIDSHSGKSAKAVRRCCYRC